MSPTLLEPGFRLDQYEVTRHIASGGMGEVYRAIDTRVGRTVALKILPVQLADRPAALERFRREARNVARLTHKNIVTLYECGQDQDFYYLAMEYVDGIDLGRVIEKKGRVKPEEARRILIQAAKALDHAFKQGIIHRDIKPSNILLARRANKGFLKLTDFGLSRTINEDEYRVTTDGSTVGTIDYMSPEQARDSNSADIRSDIYSLGCTAYHMLAGKPPFSEGGLGERVYKHMAVAPRDIRELNPLVSYNFWKLIERMLAKKPEDRFQEPSDLLTELKHTGSVAEENDELSSFPVMMLSTPSMDESDFAGFGVSRGSNPPEAPSVMMSPTKANTGTPCSGISMEQFRAAAGQFERAQEVLNEGLDDAYARQLLLSCLKLDPTHTACRKMLRDVVHKKPVGFLGRMLRSLRVLGRRASLMSAKRACNWRKVLERGEAVLECQPKDVSTHQDMATAALALDLPSLAVWLLEQGRDQVPDSKPLLVNLAEIYEARKDLKRAIAVWEQVRKVDPEDLDVPHKIDSLSVHDHIRRANYRR